MILDIAVSDEIMNTRPHQVVLTLYAICHKTRKTPKDRPWAKFCLKIGLGADSLGGHFGPHLAYSVNSLK